MSILDGIVIALILIGLFALLMLMPSPMGSGRGPPRQGRASASSPLPLGAKLRETSLQFCETAPSIRREDTAEATG